MRTVADGVPDDSANSAGAESCTEKPEPTSEGMKAVADQEPPVMSASMMDASITEDSPAPPYSLTESHFFVSARRSGEKNVQPAPVTLQLPQIDSDEDDDIIGH
jgi:hypothetical protein